MPSASRPVEGGVACTAFSLFAALALGACSDAQDASNDAAAPGAAGDSSVVDPATVGVDAGSASDGGAPAPDASARDASMPTGGAETGAGDAETGAGDAQQTAPTRPTACAGKPLPPRALGKTPPFAVGPEGAGLAPYWPTDGWRKESPDKLGFDAAKLAAAVAHAAPMANTQAVFVVRHGYVAAESYSRGFTATTQHESYSMAKSFSSGLIGIALAEGKIPFARRQGMRCLPAAVGLRGSVRPAQPHHH